MNKKYVGGSFDDFLREEGILGEVEAAAIKRVIAYQISQEMRKQKITKKALAEKMQTSRASLDRLLDEKNSSVTLATLGKVAAALGKQLTVQLS